MRHKITTLAAAISFCICMYNFNYDLDVNSYKPWTYLTLGLLYWKLIQIVGTYKEEE